jgi:tRNA threonylcarbamoyladenosine biosynthesis protein TsaB
MLVLGINTASSQTALACVRDGRLLASLSLENEPRGSEKLILEIKKFLRFLALDLKQIEVLSIVSGPGSYTGLRLGLVTVKTLAQMQGQKVVLVDSLEDLAFQASTGEGLLLAATRASKQFLNAAFFTLSKGDYRRVTDDLILEEDVLLARLAAVRGRIFLAGDLQPLYDKMMNMEPENKVVLLTPELVSSRQAVSVAFMGHRQALAGSFEKDIRAIKPFYLHPVRIIKKDFQYDLLKNA